MDYLVDLGPELDSLIGRIGTGASDGLSATELADGTACCCPENCGCGNTADLFRGEVALCGCCLADCPDVHGDEGLTWRSGYQVMVSRCDEGFELRVIDIGVTQCIDRADAETAVRDYLVSLEREDARSASVVLWECPE